MPSHFCFEEEHQSILKTQEQWSSEEKMVENNDGITLQELSVLFLFPNKFRWSSIKEHATKEVYMFNGQELKHFMSGGFYGPKMCAFLGDPVPP